MSIEFHFRKSRLATILAQAAQRAIFKRCSPPGPGVYVDRVDTVPNMADFAAVPGSDMSVDVRLPADIFVVTTKQLEQSVNAVPSGALVPACRATLIVRVSVAGVRLVARPQGADLTGVEPPELAQALETLLATLLNGMDNMQLFDGSAYTAMLGQAASSRSRLSVIGQAVAIELDPVGAPADRLDPSQEWGAFVTGADAVAFGVSKVPSAITSLGLDVSAQWAPDGTVPGVTGQIALDLDAVRLVCPIEMHFSVIPGNKPILRIHFHWSFDTESSVVLKPLAWLIDGAFALAFLLADSFIEEQFGKLGAVRTGTRSYDRDIPLENPEFAEATLLLTGLQASPAGMTLGGVVKLLAAPQLWASMGQPHIDRFGKPAYWSANCRGESGRPPALTPSGVSYSAGVTFSDQGAFCGIDFLQGSAQPAGLHVPDFQSESPHGVGYDLNTLQAAAIRTPVRFILRTARGVRCIDLGMPVPVVLDRDGYVTNYIDNHVEYCQYIEVRDSPWSLVFGGHDESGTGFGPRPPEDPNWLARIDRGYGVNVHLVTVTGLAPGEVLQFRSASHRLFLAAGPEGRVTVPAIVPSHPGAEPARLTRLSGGTLEGLTDIRSVQMSPIHPFIMPDAIGQYPDGGLGIPNPGNVAVAAAPSRLVGRDEADPSSSELNPQPLPPRALDADARFVKAALADMVAHFPVPGFADAPVAIVVTSDGRKLIVEWGVEGKARVSGTFEGAIGAWAPRQGATRHLGRHQHVDAASQVAMP